ncbi:hypothetical protein [Lentzea sp. NBRC 105346]|uniref:hypothetical protein n=1 Tax=Lentzea sp. NBRC 105346 TaxID=3032205 RepID=UPI002554B471|nr:hypothetical protein [Lentzea sp. NBRC 105346]
MVLGWLVLFAPFLLVPLAFVPVAERRGYWIDLRGGGGPAWRNYVGRMGWLALHVVVAAGLFAVLYASEPRSGGWWLWMLLPGAAVAFARLAVEGVRIVRTLIPAGH